MKSLILKLIKLYQSQPQRFPACRFSPTCSAYSYQAIDKYGILKGGLLSLKRIFKCHPFHPGGVNNLN
ncbi:MAG: membrane protein insertion efficiency factor YidD [Candidatus Beckwithbacteria bacterium]